MKKYILFLFIIMANVLNSQQLSFLNKDYSSILTHYSYYQDTREIEIAGSRCFEVVFEEKNEIFLYKIDEDNICRTIFYFLEKPIPFIEELNRLAVVNSPTDWTLYNENYVILVSYHIKNDLHFFKFYVY